MPLIECNDCGTLAGKPGGERQEIPDVMKSELAGTLLVGLKVLKQQKCH